MGNVRKQVQQIAKKEQELAEAKEAAEREKLMVHMPTSHSSTVQKLTYKPMSPPGKQLRDAWLSIHVIPR